MAVLSSTFESSLGLSAYVQFSSYLDSQNASICRVLKKELTPSLAQGLGTYKWLKEDITTDTVKIGRSPYSGFIEASVADADLVLKRFQMNHNTVVRSSSDKQVRTYQLDVDSAGLPCSLKVQEIGLTDAKNVLVFIHGFLGTSEDWMPVMKAISESTRCISVDLPGHGGSRQQAQTGGGNEHGPSMSIEVVGDILYQVIQHISPQKATLVGYSMGARIALYMALKFGSKIEGAVIISGSPGLKDASARKLRRLKDDSRARTLAVGGLQLFLDNWYTGELWDSLRSHPHFNQIFANRLQHDDIPSLAKAVSDMSIGRQLSLWGELKQCPVPLLLIVGEKDGKFRRIAHEMFVELGYGSSIVDGQKSGTHEMIVVPNCGHAVHMENPIAVISALRRFLTGRKAV